MPHVLDQLLPSLQSLGIWSYWIIGAASMLEAFFLTGVVVPGTLVVDAAGILAQRGFLDFFDLVWFVAIGSILGGEIGYWTGRWGSRRLFARFDPNRSQTFRRAHGLFQRHGGLAMVVGRFLGPVAGFLPLAAAIAGMTPRRFRLWNALGSIPYAFAHLALGYFFGDVFARVGPATTRIALFAAAATLVLAVLAYMVVRIERNLPALLSVGGSLLDALGRFEPVQAWRARHPALGAFLGRRLDRSHFFGLPAMLVGLTFTYVFVIYLGSVFDVLMATPIVQADRNIATLMHVFRNPLLIQLAAYVTAFGIWQTVTLILLAAVASLLLAGRAPLAAGLVTSVVGNVVTVAILKLAFHRARPEFAYFVESTNSFPSGHAAISVACYGMLAFVAWRVRLLGPIMAALLALLAAFLIGLSRLYLIEHYLSDVLNGYLVGAMWLLIGVSVAEWLKTRAAGPGALQAHRRLSLGILGRDPSGMPRGRGHLQQGSDPAGRAGPDRDRRRPVQLLPDDPRTRPDRKHRRHAAGPDQSDPRCVRQDRPGGCAAGRGPDPDQPGHPVLDPECGDGRDVRHTRPARPGHAGLLGRHTKRDDLRGAGRGLVLWDAPPAAHLAVSVARSGRPDGLRGDGELRQRPALGGRRADGSAGRCRSRRADQGVDQRRPGPEDRKRAAAGRGCHPPGSLDLRWSGDGDRPALTGGSRDGAPRSSSPVQPGDGVVDTRGFKAPAIGAATTGLRLPSTGAPCAIGPPRVPATASAATMTARSACSVPAWRISCQGPRSACALTSPRRRGTRPRTRSGASFEPTMKVHARPSETRGKGDLEARDTVLGVTISQPRRASRQTGAQIGKPTLSVMALRPLEGSDLELVRAAGVEPARPFGPGILSAMCLPFHHARTAQTGPHRGHETSLSPWCADNNVLRGRDAGN